MALRPWGTMRNFNTAYPYLNIFSENYEVDALESLPEAKRSNECGDCESDAKESKTDDEAMDIWVLQVHRTVSSDKFVIWQAS